MFNERSVIQWVKKTVIRRSRNGEKNRRIIPGLLFVLIAAAAILYITLSQKNLALPIDIDL
jgi:hypothetical protein